MKTFLVFMSIVAVSHSSAILDAKSVELKYLELVTKLKYKDSCSYADEEVRTNWTVKVVQTNPLSWGYTELVNGFKNDVILNNKNFCAAEELVSCDKETEKCKCGVPGGDVLLPNSPDNYVEEVDDNGVLRCRWGQGSGCISDDIFQGKSIGAYMNSKCRRGTRCTSTNVSSDCSFLTLLRYIHVKYGFGGFMACQADIVKDLLGGKICSCEPESTLTLRNTSTRQKEIFKSV